jgi:hypothetical protein
MKEHKISAVGVFPSYFFSGSVYPATPVCQLDDERDAAARRRNSLGAKGANIPEQDALE